MPEMGKLHTELSYHMILGLYPFISAICDLIVVGGMQTVIVTLTNIN